MRVLFAISALLETTWLGIIMLFHIARPELDPRTRMISEYACGPGGWVMQLAFFCMATSCWALAIAIGGSLRPFGPALLALCGIGCAGAGVFVTDPVLPMEPSQTRSGALHLLFAFGTMLLFPVMASIVGAGLAGTMRGVWPIRWLGPLTLLPWAGLIGFIATGVVAAKRPRAPLGYAERFLVLSFSVWQIAVAVALASNGAAITVG